MTMRGTPALDRPRTPVGDERGGRPIMVAIAGDSAAGKTTLASGLVAICGRDRVTTVCTDDYHRYDRQQRARLGITPLHPECNYIDVIEQHLELLAAGRPILKPVYEHSAGTFGVPEYVVPRDVVVVEGLLPLSTMRMARCFDVAVYLDPPEELRYRWKVRRDCSKRGYTPDQVLAELKRREPDSEAFIRPQRKAADVVVRFQQRTGNGTGDDAHLDVRLVLRSTIPHPDLSDVVESDRRHPIRLLLGRDAGRPVDFLEIDGSVGADQAAALEKALWERIDGGASLPGVGRYAAEEGTGVSHPLALTQLLIVAMTLTTPARV